MMLYLLDSVVLIDHFNGIEAATEYLARHYQMIAVSVITRAEVLAGFDAASQATVKAVMGKIPHFSVTRDDADLAADLRRQYRWKLPDALQAAIALNNQLKLVTRNTKDFDPQRHGFVVVPYTLI